MQEVPRERELGQAEMRSISELERDCKMVGGLSNYQTEYEKKGWADGKGNLVRLARTSEEIEVSWLFDMSSLLHKTHWTTFNESKEFAAKTNLHSNPLESRVSCSTS